MCLLSSKQTFEHSLFFPLATICITFQICDFTREGMLWIYMIGQGDESSCFMYEEMDLFAAMLHLSLC